MARYVGPVCRLCRRHGEKLMLKGDRCYTPKCAFERRPTPPGMRTARRRKVSDRGLQLREKQRARSIYGLLERQFRGYYHEAIHQPGVTGDNLLKLLESRLDNVVYRLGWADSRNQARQVVRHGQITVGGRKVNVPSARIKPGDIIGWTEGARSSEYFAIAKERVAGKSIVSWLTMNPDAMTGQALTEVNPAEAELLFDPSVIVEYYSR